MAPAKITRRRWIVVVIASSLRLASLSASALAMSKARELPPALQLG
jgi:hypothetical protein